MFEEKTIKTNRTNFSEDEKRNYSDSNIQSSSSLLPEEKILQKFSQENGNKFTIILTNKRLIVFKKLIFSKKEYFYNLSELDSFTYKKVFNGHISFLLGLLGFFLFNIITDLLLFLATNSYVEGPINTARLVGCIAGGVFIVYKYFVKLEITIHGNDHSEIISTNNDMIINRLNKFVDAVFQQKENNN